MVLDELPDLLVLDQQFGKLLLRGVPAAFPARHDARAKRDRIDFLTHSLDLVDICQRDVNVRHPFLIMNAMPRARGRIRLNIGPPSIRASATTRLSTSTVLPRFWSGSWALPSALRITFSSIRAPRCGW
jgi:hypothetical protein